MPDSAAAALRDPERTGFLAVLAKEVAVLFAFSAIGSAAGAAYWSLKRRRRRLLAATDSAAGWGLVFAGLVVVGTVYSIVRGIRGPYLATVLMGVNGFMLGLSVGVETRLEKAPRPGMDLAGLRRNFDHSLSGNLPFALLALALVYPLDYFVEGARGGLAPKLAALLCLLGAYGFACARLAGREWRLVEIRREDNLPTGLVLAVLAFGSMAGFQVWDGGVAEAVRQSGFGPVPRLAMLIFSGLVPMRLAPALLEDDGAFAKALNLLSLGVYLWAKLA